MLSALREYSHRQSWRTLFLLNQSYGGGIYLRKVLRFSDNFGHWVLNSARTVQTSGFAFSLLTRSLAQIYSRIAQHHEILKTGRAP
jgi:hypothetical protein